MKKILLFTITLGTMLMASEYKRQISPIESFSLYSEISGKVEKINLKELDYSNKGSIIIKNFYENEKLKNMKEKLDNLRKITNLKEKNYKEYSSLASIAQSNKDDKLIELLNLKSSILELENSINDLNEIIEKKNINIDKNYFIKDILVNENENIKVGQEIIKVENHNKNKIEFYINKNDLETFKNKNFDIFVDNQKINYEEIKIDKSTDNIYISSYKVIIILDNINQFGSIVTINTKN